MTGDRWGGCPHIDLYTGDAVFLSGLKNGSGVTFAFVLRRIALVGGPQSCGRSRALAFTKFVGASRIEGLAIEVKLAMPNDYTVELAAAGFFPQVETNGSKLADQTSRSKEKEELSWQ